MQESRLDGVLSSPLAGRRLVPGAVGLVHVCDLRDQRVVGVRVCEHRADGEQNWMRRQQMGGAWPG